MLPLRATIGHCRHGPVLTRRANPRAPTMSEGARVPRERLVMGNIVRVLWHAGYAMSTGTAKRAPGLASPDGLVDFLHAFSQVGTAPLEHAPAAPPCSVTSPS